MLAGVWRGDAALTAEDDWPEPVVVDGTVLVDVAYCGFCGSDAHIVSGRLSAGPPPRVLGHEVSGTVAVLGAGVDGLRVGDRVAANLFAECGACDACQLGTPQFCTRRFVGNAGFARRALYRPGQLFVLPDDVSLRHGALLEPVATVLHAVEQSRLRPGESLLVLGGGPLGLLAAQIGRTMGAGTVAISEPVAARRERAVPFTDAVLDPAPAGLRAAMYAVPGVRRPDVVVDFAGSVAALTEAIDCLAPGGRLVVAGVAAPEATLPVRPSDLFTRELSLIGSYTTSHTARRALQLLGRLDLDAVITAELPLERVGDTMALHRSGGELKVLVSSSGG